MSSYSKQNLAEVNVTADDLVYYQWIKVMCSKKGISLLTAAYSNLFKRNFSVTTAVNGNNAKNKNIVNHTVFINEDESKENLRIRFIWGSRKKAFGFLRPKNEPISKSLQKFHQKITTKTLKHDAALTDHEIELIEMENGQHATDHTWNEILLNSPKFRLRIKNDEYQFAHNYPIIFDIKLPERSSVGFDVFPSRLDYIGDLSNLEFEWLRRKGKGKWSVCKNSSGHMYHCVPDDAGSQLQLICKMYHGKVLTSVCKSNISIVDRNVVDMTPINERHQYTAERLTDSKFRIVTYNLLADFYARTEYSKKEIFNYCDSRHLDGEYRNKVQLMELKGYNADLYCLQEVDDTMFENNLHTLFFELLGLKGIYRKKFKTEEGLAIFYNTNKFSLLADHSLVFNEALSTHVHLSDIYEIVNANANLKEKILDLSNMAQILHLECKTDSKKQIIVVNTHLYSQPNCHVVRLIQLACILRHIEHIADQEKEKISDCTISHIVCGDFNSIPGHVIDSLMLKGHLSSPYEDYQEEIYKIENLNLSHPLELSSAGEKIPFTNYSINFQWSTLDYIYYTNHLKMTQIVPMPNEKHLVNKIPSEQFTSDHLALIADFDWCSENSSWFERLINGFQ